MKPVDKLSVMDALEYIGQSQISEGDLDAVFSALQEAGYAVVPVEPTEAMAIAGGMAGEWHRGNLPNASDVYKAMIAAANKGEG